MSPSTRNAKQWTRSLSPYARLAWGVLGYNLLVILWGAYVRATGSGAGCGRHWPLCNGEVVPQSPTVKTMIEFAHRLTSGVALLLVVGMVVWAWRVFPRRHPARLGALLSLVFIVIEALLGAGLVLLEYVADDTRIARGYWVAGHLANTFLLVGSMALAAWWASGGAPVRPRLRGPVPVVLAATLAGVLLVGMTGAVTALGDTLFPSESLREGVALTHAHDAHVFVRMRLWHPTMALATGLLILVLTWLVHAPDRFPPATRTLAALLLAAFVGQFALGVVNFALLAPVSLQLLHLLMADVTWVLLVLLAASVWAEDGAVQ